VGVTGFCFGGSYTFHLAAHDTRIKAAVPFYGQPPAPDEIPQITCPILAFYGDQDANLMQSLPQLKEDMARDNKQFEAVVYPGAGHAFFNDTNAYMYNPGFAKDAWEKTLAFLHKHLAA
jgi:carboxymethylenebutenolidase